MYVCVNRPSADNLIRLKYSESETVENIKDLNHDIARTCLEKLDIDSRIEIASLSDILDLVWEVQAHIRWIINSLHYLRAREKFRILSNEACIVEMDMLKKPMGKQDQYLTLGGFVVLEIINLV